MVLLVLNAVLYVVALGLSLAVLTPAPQGALRRVRRARIALACGGGLAMSVAITLSFFGEWLASGVAGCVSIVIVTACLWYGLTAGASRRTDDDDGDDNGGGGPRKRPDPPAPPEPAGGPSDELVTDWAVFDCARAVWEVERDQVPT